MADARRGKGGAPDAVEELALMGRAIYALRAYYHNLKATLGPKGQALVRLEAETKIDIPAISRLITGRRAWAEPRKRALLLKWYARRERQLRRAASKGAGA